MRFVLIPFAICLLLYIRQENQYRFRAATALKILLTMTLTVCLTVALVRNFSPVLLLAAVGMLLCARGDFFLQYIRLDAAKFTKGILLFGLGQMCNITALSLLAPFHWCAAALLVLSLSGINLSLRYLRKPLQSVCVILCVLLAVACAAYIGLTLLFVDAVQNQPPVS